MHRSKDRKVVERFLVHVAFLYSPFVPYRLTIVTKPPVKCSLASFPGSSARLFFARSKISSAKKSWEVEPGNEANAAVFRSG